MKLYELGRGESFRLAGDDNSPVFKLDRLDGMYSLCYYIEEGKEKVAHLAGSTPVLVTNEEYNV